MTAPVNCRSCGAWILFVRTKSGRMPIDYQPEFAADTHYDKARHVSHFATCPNADKHRKRKNVNTNPAS